MGSVGPTRADVFAIRDADRRARPWGSRVRDPAVNPDFFAFIASLLSFEARFLVVGAHALAVHGVVRATSDIGVWIDPARENADRVWQALVAFGAPVAAIGIMPDDFVASDRVVQLGLPPRRIDVMTSVSGLATFDEAWHARVERDVGGLAVPFLGRDALVKNKRASGRYKDLGDVEALGEDPRAP